MPRSPRSGEGLHDPTARAIGQGGRPTVVPAREAIGPGRPRAAAPGTVNLPVPIPHTSRGVGPPPPPLAAILVAIRAVTLATGVGGPWGPSLHPLPDQD